MALTDYLYQAADRMKLNFNFNKDSITDYLVNYSLKDYFKEDIPESERKILRKDLEEKVGDTLEKFDGELRGLARKSLTKGTMGLAMINDLYAYISNVPLANVSGLGYSLFALKTAVELPAMYRYLKKSHDWYGAVSHYALKPINYLLPVIGGAMEAGSFERMVKARVIKESKYSFIKDNGDYKEFEEKLSEKLSTPLKESISLPSEENLGIAA